MKSAMQRATWVVLVGAVFLGGALPAHAGDRAFYLGLVVVPGPWPPGVEDHVIGALLQCGSEPVAQCRASHRVGAPNDLDTDGNVLLATLPATVDIAAVRAARRPAGRRALTQQLGPVGLDALVVLELDARGRVTLTAYASDGRRLGGAQRPLLDGALSDADVARLVAAVMRPVERAFVP